MPPQVGVEASEPEPDELCPVGLALGSCPRVDCPFVHGELCPCCEKLALRPGDPEQQQAHLDACVAEMERAIEHEEAVAASAGVECSICMEPVLTMPKGRFGLLPGCDHPFCLACIRDWRSTTTQGTMRRTCPICRAESFYVVPSGVWATGERKAVIMAEYRSKMAQLDCQHFKMGKGTCPFGASCHYRHRLPSGREHVPTVRFRADADGTLAPQRGVKLSDFLEAREARDAAVEEPPPPKGPA